MNRQHNLDSPCPRYPLSTLLATVAYMMLTVSAALLVAMPTRAATDMDVDPDGEDAAVYERHNMQDQIRQLYGDSLFAEAADPDEKTTKSCHHSRDNDDTQPEATSDDGTVCAHMPSTTSSMDSG